MMYQVFNYLKDYLRDGRVTKVKEYEKTHSDPPQLRPLFLYLSFSVSMIP